MRAGSVGVLGSMFLVFFIQGLTISLVAPIVSLTISEQHSLPPEFTGLIVAMDDVAIFVFSLILPYFVNVHNSLIFLVAGNLLCAACNALFSFTAYIEGEWTYFWACMGLRLLEGVAYSAAWVAGLPYLMCAVPDREGLISAVAEMGVTLGVVLGPTVASFLYFMVGYSLAFMIAAAAASVVLVLFLVTTRYSGFEENCKLEDDLLATTSIKDLLVYYTSWRVQAVTAILLVACMFISFFETALSVHFDKMDLSVWQTCLLWCMLSVSYLVMVPVSTKLTDDGCLLQLPVSGLILSLSLFVLAVPLLVQGWDGNLVSESVYLLLGGGSAITCMIPIYSVLKADAQRRGRSEPKALISGVLNAQFALGGTIGPVVFGGVLHETIGFRPSGAVLGLVTLLGTAVTTGYVAHAGMLSACLPCRGKPAGEDEGTELLKPDAGGDKKSYSQ